ncbi:MAG: L,D-transpeptidase family protein [Candidatus Parcubacteria bacterium]|nr:L,D-transpeptidase family protein [Candidatus Parcubacteria bacterium]
MYHKQLVQHIKLRLKGGFSLEEIKQDLLVDGWSEKEVEDALKNSTTPESNNRLSLPSLLYLEIPFSVTIGVIIFFALVFVFAFVFFRNTVYSYNISVSSVPESSGKAVFSYGEQPTLSNPVFFQRVKNQFITDKANFIEVDLSEKTVKAYHEGNIVLEIPVKTQGRDGSWWETPAGLYKVNTKEPDHFSAMGHVHMPWSMSFQGNFFIHGWPYYSDGTPVATTYSGGCVRLSTNDAKKLYDIINIGTPILVFKNDFIPDTFSYANIPPDISGNAFLSADLHSNYVFLQKNSEQVFPIASLTKLITALVAIEYINLDNIATVPSEAIIYTSKPRLKTGQNISVYHLLFPLLMESSNEAAETIARYYGRDTFIRRMNEKAESLGMKNTRFVDPSGTSENNVSTAEELFTLAKYIYNNRSFVFNITSGKIKNSAYGENPFSDMGNLNDFADDPRFVGGKVGKTIAAKETELSVFGLPFFNSSRVSETRPIVMITLGSDRSKNDISLMLNRIEDNFQGK